MSLPSSIVDSIKSISYNPGIISNDPELAYTLSFKDHPISHDSVHFHPRDSYQSPLSQYQFADFDDNTYDHLLQETIKNYRAKNISVVKGIRSSFKQFFTRVSALTYQSALKHNQVNFLKQQEAFQTSKMQTIKGNIPSKWPQGLNQFQKQVNQFPWNAFSTQSQLFLQDMVSQIKANITSQMKKLRSTPQNQRAGFLERITQQFQVLITISLKTLSQVFVISQVLFAQQVVSSSEIAQNQEKLICERLAQNLKSYIKSIPKGEEQSAKYHHNEAFWESNAFLLMKKVHFQNNPGLSFYSITTDGQYLYMYISAINGGMYKFGTGNKGTIAGKLYFERNINLLAGSKLQEVNWIYLKGKLYLKTLAKDPSSLEVFSPEDFKKIGTVQLACKSLFGQHVLVTLNRNSILMTDGQHLYFLGKRIKIVQNNLSKQPKMEEKKEDAATDKMNKKQKKKKKNNNQSPTVPQTVQNPVDLTEQPLRLLEIVLAEFDVTGKIQENYCQAIDQDAITQIFGSFSGYFNKQQCRRAYKLNNYDIMEACQWLFDQGNKQKEKNIKILPAQRIIVLGQSQITSSFNQKTFKSPNQIVTKQGSLLHMYNINESIWTMDTDQVTCYTQNGVKIFNKRPQQDQHKSKKNQACQNLLMRKQAKHPRNPEYTMIHDPYNEVFYTFSWYNDGHYLPCPILVSKDKKKQVQLQIQRRSSADTSLPSKITQMGRFYLTELGLLQHLNKSKNYRFNNHVWWYGQKIRQLKSQANASFDEKKRISNKKAKLMTRLNKINQITKTYQKDVVEFNSNGKVIKQIVKLYPFNADGSLQNLNQIVHVFQNVADSSNNALITSFLVVIQKWFLNSPLITQEIVQQKITLVLSILLKIRNGPLTSQINKHEISKIVIKYFYIFYKSREDAIQFLIELSPQQIQNFLKAFDGNSFIIEKEFIIFQIKKKELILNKYDSKHNLSDIFKQKSNVSLQKNNVISCLLMRKQDTISPLHSNLLSFIQNCINNLDSKLIIRFFQTLFITCLKQINSIKNPQQKVKSLTHLFQDSFKIIQKCLSTSSTPKTIQLVQVISFIVQVYYSSIVRILANQNIIKSLLRIIELIQKPQIIQFYSYIINSEFQGVSAIQQRIYETSHPLQRGRSQFFPSAYYPESSMLFLDFDKRCQTDQNHDIMTIQLLHQDNPVGNAIPCHDGVFTTNLRLTGKIQMKRPTLILGNNISVDFTSSGHAKDAQSFGRFGFRFGLRPIFLGKIFHQKGAQVKNIQKVFRNGTSFKSYVNTLKFLVVTASSTIQNIFNIQEDKATQKVKALLTGKIVRQGLEQMKKNQQLLDQQRVVNQFLNKNHQDPEKDILKKLNINFLSKEETKAQETIQQKQQKQVWAIQNIPQYIKGFIEQIKNFKGDFIEVFKQARVHAPPQGSYSHQLRRPGFTHQLQELWLQGQALLFLTVLKHSGLLHLNLKFSIEYIKENLKAFEQARNGIFYAFISRMQTVRQWRDLVQTYHGKSQQQEQKVQSGAKQQKKSIVSKNEISIRRNNRIVRTVQFQNKQIKHGGSSGAKRGTVNETEVRKPKQQVQKQRLKQVQKLIRQRLSNQFLIQQLCQLRGTNFVQNNIHENVSRIIEQIKSVNLQGQQQKQSVYIQPIRHLIKGCLFLLACKSPSTRESLEEDNDIVPMNLGRSLSSDQRNANINKVELFRQWLENWKKWKGFSKQNRVELKFPVLEIVQFINSWTDVQDVKSSINQRQKMCEHRIEFYKYLNQLLKSTSQSILFGKYVFGSQLLNLGQNYKSNLESCPLIKLDQLSQSYKEYVSTIKQIQTRFIQDQLPISYKKFLSQTKPSPGKDQQPNQEAFLDKLKINLEILYMMQSENPLMSLEIALYFINFKYLSSQNQQILFLASLVTQRAFVVEHKLSQVLEALRKQVGDNNLTAKRWKDLLFIERCAFLLRKLEVLVRKKHLQIDEKVRVAQTLFYLLNLTQVPYLSRIGLKILKKLKDVNLSSIQTPFSNKYKLISLDQDNKASTYKHFQIENKANQDNMQLLAKKSISTLKGHKLKSNQIQNNLLQIDTTKDQALKQSTRQRQQPKQSYNIILNIHQQEDLVWFLRVLYYIEQLEIQAGKVMNNQIRDWKDYLESKTIKQNKKNQQQQQQQSNNNAQQIVNVQHQQQQLKAAKPVLKNELNKERILSLIPQKIKVIDEELEQQLPIGWYMNYGNVFKEFIDQKHLPRTAKPQVGGKSGKNAKVSYINSQNINNANKKAWKSAQFLKLSKKFDQFNGKPLEQPKQGDSEQIKCEFIKAKNFISRIRRNLAQIMSLINQFTSCGYAVFRQDLPKQKALQICQLISLGAQNSLTPIKTQFKKDQYKNRIIIDDSCPLPSKIKITLIESQNYQIFDELISLESPLSTYNDSSVRSYGRINRRQRVLEDSAYLPYEDFFDVSQTLGSKELEFCREFVQSRIFKMKKHQEEVYLPDYPKLKYFVSQGGIQTGLKNVTLVPASEYSLTLQSFLIDGVLTTPSTQKETKQQEQDTDFPEQIIEKVISLIQEKIPGKQAINNEQEIMDHLLVSFYIKKLSKMDLKFVDKESLKNLAKCLVQFSQGFRSFQPIQHYESQIQKLLVKYIDNCQTNLKIFEIFNTMDYEMSPNIAGYISKGQTDEKPNEIKTETKEDFTTHHYPKSEYLLKSQAPQVEENKLLKYWEKNILQKILQFVKTTLRPLEIEDFFEQMRMPLRKNDQMQAKKIAYVICDGKLPQGAVLPDSNHNWNSFTLEDIQIGQYALIKLPKQRNESISPLLSTGDQQYRLVKIFFIDVKTLSILVRYRIDEYSIMGYLWVPINSLVRVQKQILHLSTKDLYTQIQKNIKGIIYGYSKECLTQLTSVSNLDETKLIKQTIAGMFIHDPISGWLGKTKHQWLMRHALKRMMNRNELQISDYLEQQFCPIESFETDLFTDQVVKLNRFQNATAMILSFKKSAKISLTSGIRFYKDSYLFNQFLHVYTTKAQKTQFQPLIFTDPNVYCKYYTNKECLKVSEQNKYNPKDIQVTVFGIGEIWTIGCYLGEVISQIAEEQVKQGHLQILRRINRLYIKWILEKKVAILCSELAKLVSRITNRIINVQEQLNLKTTFQSLGLDQNLVKELINWVKCLLEEERTPLSLYSQLLQNLSQMLAVILRKNLPFLKGQPVPQHIEAMVSLLNLLRRIDQHLKGKKITQKPSTLGQWQRFLLIEKIPQYVDRKQLINKMKQLLRQNKAKILSPKFDIYPKDDKLVICVQGWNITQLVQEQIVEKIQKQQEEQQKQQQQEQQLIMEWSCEVCTFVNPMGSSHCEMCGTQMQPAPVAMEVYKEVQATDVSKAESKLKELEAKRFEAIREEIFKFFHNYWEETCRKIEKENKQMQSQAKGKVAPRRKQAQKPKQQQKQKPLPQKPQVQLKTGSQFINDPIIESFLQNRLIGFKQNVKKLVESEPTFLAKFKKLETLGYDLWCDNIFHENPTLIPFQRLYQLMNYIQGQICKGSSSVLSYSQNSIRLLSTISLLEGNQHEQPINYLVEDNIVVKTKYKNLAELKSYNVRYSWKIVKQLNVAASKCLQFINMNLRHMQNDTQTSQIKESDCLGYKIKCFRNLIMGAIKLQLSQKIIQKTSVLRQPEQVPKIYLQRLRVRQQRGKDHKPITIREKDDYLFTKAHEQFSKVSPAMLRPFKPKGTDPYLSFSVTFRGQMAMGQAGPYRQFFTDISSQLDPKNCLGLFIPTPNNKYTTGQARSKWTINPNANSSYHLSLFQFLGIMMGCCIRTGTHLALDLPKIFWKLLVSEKITDSDLEQTDHKFVQTLKMIKDIPNEQMFEQLQEYTQPITQTYTTSDGEQHEMVHNGKSIKVVYEQREKYIRQVKRKRVYQAVLQINKIKKGLQEMMPQSYFNCITGDQIKLMVCGRPKVDVELLRKHTKYAGGLNQQQKRIKYFWQVMKQIQQADKLKVIKFCWGQQRLPINSEQFERNNIRFMIKPMMNQKNGDQSLPKADTCFFNIELPNYSTKEILKEKLLLAVNMDCVSINADENFNPEDNPLMNEIQDDNIYDDNEEETEW